WRWRTSRSTRPTDGCPSRTGASWPCCTASSICTWRPPARAPGASTPGWHGGTSRNRRHRRAGDVGLGGRRPPRRAARRAATARFPRPRLVGSRRPFDAPAVPRQHRRRPDEYRTPATADRAHRAVRPAFGRRARPYLPRAGPPHPWHRHRCGQRHRSPRHCEPTHPGARVRGTVVSNGRGKDRETLRAADRDDGRAGVAAVRGGGPRAARSGSETRGDRPWRSRPGAVARGAKNGGTGRLAGARGKAPLRLVFRDHFSGVAAAYAAFRPQYPAELFAALAHAAPRRGTAWDCARGNGQAAVGLAPHFESVIATDGSAAQLAAAQPHPRVRYLCALAETAP